MIIVEPVLSGLVERIVPALRERASTIVAIDRQRSAFASSYASDVLTVRLRSGEARRIFLKDFCATTFAKDDMERRRDRERNVYHELLADAGLGTARCYASLWDESRRVFWLLLEYVDGAEVRSCALDYWLMAAAWLARLEAHFAPRADRLSACDCLVRHDVDFFRSSAESALLDLRRISAPLADRLASVLEPFDDVVQLATDQHRTLVHGHYRPCNIIAAIAGEPARVCAVDWEQAAFGSVFYDLALLSDGFEPPELDRFVAAYREEALAHHLDVPDHATTLSILSCFRLLLGVHLLSRARERGFSEQKAAKAVARLERLSVPFATHGAMI